MTVIMRLYPTYAVSVLLWVSNFCSSTILIETP